MVFPGSWTFSWFLRWSLRRNALWQTSQRKVFVWLWIRMCRFNLNFDVNFLSQSGRKSLIKTYFKLAHLESCTRMEFLLCESTHAACDGNVRFNQPHFCSHHDPENYSYEWNEYSIKKIFAQCYCILMQCAEKAMWHGCFIVATLYDAIWQQQFSMIFKVVWVWNVNAICKTVQTGWEVQLQSMLQQVKCAICTKVTQHLSHPFNCQRNAQPYSFPFCRKLTANF